MGVAHKTALGIALVASIALGSAATALAGGNSDDVVKIGVLTDIAELGPSFAALQFKRRTLLGANCATCRSNSFSRATPRPGPGGSFSVAVFRKAARCCSNPKPSRGSQRLLVQRGRLCDCHVAVARALSVRCNFPKHAGLLDDAYQHDRRGHAFLGGRVPFPGVPRRPSTLDLRDYAANESLGAILTFARTPLFSVHALTTLPWDMSPSEDQQLGGLIMWVIGGAILAAWGIFALLLSVTEKDETDAFQRESVRARARVG